MSPRMRAAVLAAPRRVVVDDVPRPDPGPDQVRVRLEGCGVCASNLPAWEGRSWFTYPLDPGAPGHEGWGRIDAVGRDVRGLRPGERVALLSYNAYAEYDLARADGAVPLPSTWDGVPFPGEALACAMNVMRRADVRPGQRVAVVGVGFLGALLVELASRRGARVFALSRRQYALQIARRAGAEEVMSSSDAAAAREAVMRWSDGEGCHRVIEATGKQEPLTLAGELCRVRARLVVAGYHQDGSRVVDMLLWNRRGLDVVNAHERAPEEYVRGMKEAVEHVARGEMRPRPLLTSAHALDDLGGAFDGTLVRPDGFVKAWIDLTR